MNFTRLNNILGWLVWAIATVTFVATIEPTASFWDCGEYIACAFKMEVGHAPGAPFFLVIARFFGLFAGGDTSKVAYMINVMSALSSSFTILFLFWTITKMGKKMAIMKDKLFSNPWQIAVLAAGTVGALAYTFSDSFWFSAVEGEVYAMSSFFTAVSFWAILKWEEQADQANNMRWIVLIALLVGLSIGVHLLNLLVIPAIVFIYYFKKYKTITRNGLIAAGIISVVLLGFIQAGLIPSLAQLSADFDLLFVNTLGMPFNLGTFLYMILVIALPILFIYYTNTKNEKVYTIAFYTFIVFSIFAVASGQTGKSMLFRLITLGASIYFLNKNKTKLEILNTIALSFIMIVLGFSTYFILVIRSQANTPIDENNVENAINLVSYLNREQYGDWPIAYGQYYNTPLLKEQPYKDGSPVYEQSKVTGKYEVIDDRKNSIPNYDPEFCTPFPRMWNGSQQAYVQGYKVWGDIKGTKKFVTDENGEQKEIIKPKFGENLGYFFKYQIGYMYLRYFAWNFIGRQNDVQGTIKNATDGNMLTGIDFLDKAFNGTTSKQMPYAMKNNKAANKLYGFPFILGLLGFFYQLKRNNKDLLVVFLLFFFTGLAIVVYLNQNPYQPRERDYAYAASFYAYAIWIGLGVMSIFEFFTKYMKGISPALAAGALSLVAVPVIMAKEGFDDHDRSKRTMSRDFAINYLQSCEKNAILFTNGDNDTFPLWYAQEIEGIRTDVRVVNLSLLQTDWYIAQMRRAAYESELMPYIIPQEKLVGSKLEVVYFSGQKTDAIDVKTAMNLLAIEDPSTKLPYGDRVIDALPTSTFSVNVDSTAVVNNGTVQKDVANRIVKKIEWKINRSYITKNDLMILDLLAANDWKRPIYFAVTTGSEAYIGLQDYFQLEGLTYRLVPVKNRPDEMQSTGARVYLDKMYDNVVNKFQWGGMKSKGVNLDENCLRMSLNMRLQMGVLSNALIDAGKSDKALKVIDKMLTEMPDENVPYDASLMNTVIAYYKLKDVTKATALSNKIFGILEGDYNFYTKLDRKKQIAYGRELQQCEQVMSQLTQQAMVYGNGKHASDLEKRFVALFGQSPLAPMTQPQDRMPTLPDSVLQK